MAILALLPKEPGVDGRLSVAAQASGGCASELLVCVAGITTQGLVTSIQHENLAMLKALHTIFTIMTLQAILPVLSLVTDHEEGVFLVVAADATR